MLKLGRVHRLIPSRFPPVLLFDWASSAQELEEIGRLEGLTNQRLQTEYGSIYLVPPIDWVSGEGSTPLMAAFTHPGKSRFSDGSFGIYYAGDSLQTAIAETKFHRERFLNASKEAPCQIQMREYITTVVKPLVTISQETEPQLLDPDLSSYSLSQLYGSQIKAKNEWGIFYPSVRLQGGTCVAILRPPALKIPIQGSHLEYIWDGKSICEIRKAEIIVF